MGRYFGFNRTPIWFPMPVFPVYWQCYRQRWMGLAVTTCDSLRARYLSGLSFRVSRLSALSSGPCKPFDKNRNGLHSVKGLERLFYRRKILSSELRNNAGGGSSNDSNIYRPILLRRRVTARIKMALSAAKKRSVDTSLPSTATLYQ